MRPIFMPERARALRADWAPGPGVFVLRETRSIHIRGDDFKSRSNQANRVDAIRPSYPATGTNKYRHWNNWGLKDPNTSVGLDSCIYFAEIYHIQIKADCNINYSKASFGLFKLYIDMQPNDFSADPQKTWATTVPVSSSGSQLDVQSSDSKLFAALGHILSGQHGSIRRRLVSVCLHLHPTSHAADRFPGNKRNGQPTGNHHIPVNIPLLRLALTCRTGQWRGRRCRWKKRRCDTHQTRSLLRPPEDPGWSPAPPSSLSLYEEPLSVDGRQNKSELHVGSDNHLLNLGNNHSILASSEQTPNQ